MKFDPLNLLKAASMTVRDPRRGARMVMSLSVPRRQRWELLLLSVVIGMVLIQIVGLFSLGATGQTTIAGSAILAVLQLASLFGLVAAVHLIGKSSGGHGSFDDAILLIAWLQFTLSCLQVTLAVAVLLVPSLYFIITLLGAIAFLWMLTFFVAELHGFKSTLAVFLSIMMVLVLVGIILQMLLGAVGIPILEI